MKQKFVILLVVTLTCAQDAEERSDGGSGNRNTLNRRKNVGDLPLEGDFCQAGNLVICHRDIRFRFAKTTAKVCNNGNLETMRVPADYPTPEIAGNKECPCKTCTDSDGTVHCNGAEIIPRPKPWLRRVCESDGIIYEINVASGRKTPSK